MWVMSVRAEKYVVYAEVPVPDVRVNRGEKMCVGVHTGMHSTVEVR